MPGKKGGKAKTEKRGEVIAEKPIETSDKTEDKVEEEDEPLALASNDAGKRSRGRPKKSDGEPDAKRPKQKKKLKQFTPPSRMSGRLSNQKTGRKLPDVEEEEKSPKKRNRKPKAKAKEEEEEEEETVEPSHEENAEPGEEVNAEAKDEVIEEPEQSTNGANASEVAATS